MNVTRRYILCTFITVALGALAYGVADADLTPFLISVPLLITAWMINGAMSPTPVPRWAINLALLAATVNMAMSWTDSIADTVGVLCRYLVWLQLIKMFEPRTPRDQAQVLVLSAMLLVGSCLTSVTPELGAVLLAYLPMLLVTTMLYQVWSEHYAVMSWEQNAGAAPAAARDLRRRLLDDASKFLGRGARAAGVSAQPPLARGSRRDFRRVCLLAGVGIVAIAALIYVVLPRGIGAAMISPWQAQMRLQPVVGFRNHVQLGASGVLSESRRPVASLKLEYSDQQAQTGKPVLLRGAILDEYDPEKRTWRRSAQNARGDVSINSDPLLRWMPRNYPGPYVVQKLTIFEGGADDIFTVWQPIRIDFDQESAMGIRFTWNRYDGALSVPSAARGISVTITSAPRALAPEGPYQPVGSGPWVAGIDRYPGQRAGVPAIIARGPIREHAERLLAEARINVEPTDPAYNRIVASVITRWLGRECVYTREMVAPEEGQDPIEMFLFDPVKGKRGHCEYFASALAAMCLSMEVPARVITGYVASEFDTATGAYIIRESHAHAWVEVEVRPGMWESFDPSPSSETQWAAVSPNIFAAAVRGVLDKFELAWVRSIVGFDSRQQAGAIRSVSALSPVAAFKGLLDGTRRLNEWLGGVLRRENQSAEPSEQRVVIRFITYVFIGGGVGVVLAYLLVTRLIVAIARRAKGSAGPPRFEQDPRAAELIAVYEALLHRLDRAGAAKPLWQPIESHIRGLAETRPALAAAAGRIVSLYYRCRFAGEPVTGPLLVEARRALRDARQAARG